MEDYNTIEYKNHSIRIVQDEDAESPREWDNIGTMTCFHSRYTLGDDHNFDDSEGFFNELTGLDEYDFEEYDDYQKAVENEFIRMAEDREIFMLDLFLYDHSGITMSTSPFSCPWDSGKVGFIYVTMETLKKECIENKTDEEIYSYLKNEVKIYDDYLTGACFGYQAIDENEEEIDSCWGFYGYDHEKSGLVYQAEDSIDWHIKETEKEIFEEFKIKEQNKLDAIKKNHNKIKAWIKNKVPLRYRLNTSVCLN